MARLKPVSACVYLNYACSSCGHIHQVRLTKNEEMILLCPKCENPDYSVPVSDFRVVYDEGQTLLSKLPPSETLILRDKVVAQLKKLGFSDAEHLVSLALKKGKPNTWQNLFKMALAEVEVE